MGLFKEKINLEDLIYDFFLVSSNPVYNSHEVALKLQEKYKDLDYDLIFNASRKYRRNNFKSLRKIVEEMYKDHNAQFIATNEMDFKLDD